MAVLTDPRAKTGLALQGGEMVQGFLSEPRRLAIHMDRRQLISGL